MRSWSLRGATAWAVLLLSGSMLADAAKAEVVAKSDIGFVVRNTVEVKATPGETWRTLVNPPAWWLRQHTFSGDAANLTLDPVAGGCFCEKLPIPAGAPKGQQPGGVQHLRVIYVEPGKALRLSGALGPLQSEALTGTLTITIKPTEAGTRILFEYVVGGFMRYNVDEIGPAVDHVLAAQLASLAKKLGPIEPAVQPAPESAATAPPVPERAPPPVDETRAPPGIINRSGRVWSLPPAPGTKALVPGPVGAPVPKPVVAHPVPAKPVPVKAVPAATTAKAPPLKPAPLKPAPVKAGSTGAAAKPAPKAKATPEDQDRRDGIDAFDQALGTSNP